MVVQHPGDFSQDVSGLLTKALNSETRRVSFLKICKWSLGILMSLECEAAPAPGGAVRIAWAQGQFFKCLEIGTISTAEFQLFVFGSFLAWLSWFIHIWTNIKLTHSSSCRITLLFCDSKTFAWFACPWKSIQSQTGEHITFFMFLGRTPDCRFDAIEHHVDSGVPGLNQSILCRSMW